MKCDFQTDVHCFAAQGDVLFPKFSDIDFTLFELYAILVGYYFFSMFLGMGLILFRSWVSASKTVFSNADSHIFNRPKRRTVERILNNPVVLINEYRATYDDTSNSNNNNNNQDMASIVIL